MKGLFVAAIASVFTLVVAVSVVYGYGASTSCWESNGSQYASAMAGSYGLHDGSLSVLARVDTYQDDDQATFANEFISLTAWASSDAGDPFLAQSAVGGLDNNNEFQNDASRCPQQ